LTRDDAPETRRGRIIMTKAEIIARIYEKVGFSKKDATDVVEATFDIIKSCLERGEKVKISGFGNFVVNTKRPRKGRNPQTGDEIIIVGRKVLTFKASQIMKKTLNAMSAPPSADSSPATPASE
jgi:integration host factor subunit alpha